MLNPRFFTKPPSLQSPRPEDFAAMRAAFQSLLPSVEEMHTRLRAVFTQKYPTFQERIAAIEAKALNMHPDTDYRDMIYDELTTNPDRTDDEIASLVAQRYAFP